MLVTSILIFAMSTFFVSFIIGSISKADKGKVATITTMIAWGSLLCGLYLLENFKK